MTHNLNEKIRAHRERHGLSQEQLGGLLGISPHDVARWESGDATPDTAQIMRLSDIFGVTTDYLLKDVANGVSDDRSNSPTPRSVSRSIDISIAPPRITAHRRKNIFLANIYGIALVAFLILGIGFQMWHPGWLVFVAAWVISDIRSIRFSIYGVALIVFFVLGFWFGEWRWTWIVFPVAWLLSSLVNDHRRNTHGRPYFEEDDDDDDDD